MKKFTIMIFLLLVAGFNGSCSRKKVNYSDKTPPRVIETYPENGATGVTINLDQIVITFSEAIDSDSATFSSLKINVPLYGTLKVVENRLYLYPFYPLQYDTNYRITVTRNVKDLFGNKLKKEYTLSFTTEHDTIPPPPPIIYHTLYYTNQNPFMLGGVKQTDSGIKVNGKVYVPVDYTTDFNIELNLTEGKNTFQLTAFDKAGNESSPVTVTVILDTIPPSAPEVTAPVRTRNDLVEVYGKKDSDSEVIIDEESTGFQICDNKASQSSWKCDITFPDEGKRCFSAVSVDVAGNRSDQVSFCITRDITPPSIFSIENTSPTGGGYLAKGTREAGSLLFLNGSEFQTGNGTLWQVTNSVKTGYNILNFSLTDDLFNSSQFIYTFYHDSQPPLLIGSYPQAGTTFEAPVTEVTLFFNKAVTFSAACSITDIVSSPFQPDEIKFSNKEVTIHFSSPVSGTNLNLYVNAGCFVTGIPQNPSWWMEFPKEATTISGRAWNLHFKNVGTSTEEIPQPAYPEPVSISGCDYYSCAITISPFYSDFNMKKEELLFSLSTEDYSYLSTSATFKEQLYLVNNIPPFSCPKITLSVKNISGNHYVTDVTLTPTFYSSFLTEVSGVAASSYYSKVVTGDWNGDGIPDVAFNIIKNPPGGYDAEVLIFIRDTNMKIIPESMKIISYGSSGYAITISRGVDRDYLLLTEPVKGLLGIYRWDSNDPTIIPPNRIQWEDLGEILNLAGEEHLGIDILNLGSFYKGENTFMVLTPSHTEDNIFILNGNFEIIDSIYLDGLYPRYRFTDVGNFAGRGNNAKTLCISGHIYDNGRGKITCFYQGTDFPQEYPFFDVKGNSDSAQLGDLFTLADVNGDGFDDIIARNWDMTKDNIEIFLGGDYPDEKIDKTISHLSSYFIGKFKYSNISFILFNNISSNALMIWRANPLMELKYPYYYRGCVDGELLTSADRMIQIGPKEFIIMRASALSGETNTALSYLEIP